MFLYEAVECLFEEMHLNNQNNQQRNFMIDSTNFLPSQPNSSNTQSNTLPNLSNYLISQQQQGNTQALSQRNHSNEAIGVRIQSYTQDRRDPLSAIPLTNPNQNLKNSQMNILLLNAPIINDLEAIAIDTSNVSSSNINNNKTSFVIDLPRIFPSFLTKTSNETNGGQNSSSKNFIKHFNRRSSGTSNLNNSRRSSSGVHHNNRAFKFMNTVITKSASFKRVLFPQTTQDTSCITQQKQQDNKQSDSKPSMMIALASASSTSSSSSSSTTVVQTTTESSLSSKSANLVQSSSCSVSPNSVTNKNINSSNSNIIKNNKTATSQSTSNNNLNASMCTINTPITIISTQLNKTTSQSNLKLN